MTETEELLLAVIRNERQRWAEIRRYTYDCGNHKLVEAMDQASRRYAERARAREETVNENDGQT